MKIPEVPEVREGGNGRERAGMVGFHSERVGSDLFSINDRVCVCMSFSSEGDGGHGSDAKAQAMEVGLGVTGLATAPPVLSLEAGRAQCMKYFAVVDKHDSHRLPTWRYAVFFGFQGAFGDLAWRLREAMETEAELMRWCNRLLSATDTFKKRIRENLKPGEGPKTGDVDVAVATMEFASANIEETVTHMLHMLKPQEKLLDTVNPEILGGTNITPRAKMTTLIEQLRAFTV